MSSVVCAIINTSNIEAATTAGQPTKEALQQQHQQRLLAEQYNS